MKDEEREEHMIIAKIAYCRAVIELERQFKGFANQDIGNLVNEEFEESSSLAEQHDAASSALGVDSLHDNDFQPKFIEMTEQVIGDLESGKTLGRPE